MNTRIDADQRRIRLGSLLVLLIAIALLLSGCSSSGDESSDSGGDGNYSASDADYAAEDAAAEEGGDSSAASPANRDVIVTGAMYMTVEDPITAADDAVGIVRTAGGRVDARSEVAPTEYDGGSAWLTLRIPSDDLEPVVDDLRKLGTVDEFSTDSYDVTREVTDLEAQISTLRASTARIESLLLEAEDISDIIKLEDELDRRRAELESLEARQRGLDDQVSMSAIDLTLTTEPVVYLDDDPRNFWDGLMAGWNGLVSFLSGALVVFGVLLPWLVLMAAIALVVILAVRARRSRKSQPVSASAVSPAAQQPEQPAAATTPPPPPTT